MGIEYTQVLSQKNMDGQGDGIVSDLSSVQEEGEEEKKEERERGMSGLVDATL